MTTATQSTHETLNLDPDEVQRFERMAKEWWDPTGKFRPLHQIGPARLAFVREQLQAHFRLEGNPDLRPLDGLTVLDIGCGGGLISEPLARMGADVTGIDPGKLNIAIAQSHAEESNLAIDYRNTTVEDLAATGATFDAVVCLEVVEHVPDVAEFVAACGALVRPGGALVFSTINRTVKSYLFAIVAAEYILQWLPKGTHQWERFVTPDELAKAMREARLAPGTSAGMIYNPMTDVWLLKSEDTSVNYLMAGKKPA